MASFAPLYHDLWDDADFRALTPEARLLYLLLMSHKKCSRVGLHDLLPDRWAAKLGFPVDAPLGELVSARFVLVDRDTFELLVRTKVKHDPPKSWQQASAVWKAWAQIESPRLAEVVVGEMPGEAWGHDRAPAPVDKPGCGTPSDTHSDTPSDRASDTPPRADTSTSTYTYTQHQSPLTPDERIAAAVEAVMQRRGTEQVALGKANPPGWLAATRKGIERDLRDHDGLGKLIAKGAPPDRIADLIEPRTVPAVRPPAHDPDCPECGSPEGLILDDEGFARRCARTQLRAVQ